MCGLMFVRSHDGVLVKNRVLKRYQQQKARGTEGFGFVALNGGKVVGYKRRANEAEIIADIEKVRAAEMLFHHRHPTSTANVPEAAHPIKIDRPELSSVFYVAHNGVIGNAAILQAQHEVEGWVYQTGVTEQVTYKAGRQKYQGYEITSFNDSEALAIDLVKVLAGIDTEMKSTGSIAFICLETDRKKKALRLYYGRNHNPLLIEQNKNFFCLRSEGGGQAIKAHTLYCYDYSTGETTETDFDVGAVYKWQPQKGTTYLPEPKTTIGFGGGGYDARQPTLEEQFEAKEYRYDFAVAELEELEEQIYSLQVVGNRGEPTEADRELLLTLNRKRIALENEILSLEIYATERF